MAHFIKAGCGFNAGPSMQDFARAAADTPLELAPKEYARPGHVIGYIAGNPASSLGFLRPARVRVHVRKDLIGTDGADV
jgi:hypothetical protein